MNITLTNDQFNEIKDGLTKEIAEDIKASVKDSIVRYVKNFKLDNYEVGEIRNVIKSSISSELKDKVLAKIEITKIENEITKRVNQRVQSALTKILKNKIEVNIGASLSIEE